MFIDYSNFMSIPDVKGSKSRVCLLA